MNKSILLIAPPCKGSNIRFGENLGIRYICSFLLANGYESDILECTFKDTNFTNIVKIINNYDVVGFSLNYSGQYESAKEIIKIYLEQGNSGTEIKHKKIFIAGGHYATFQHKFILNDCSSINYIVLGESENVMLQLVKQSFKKIEKIPKIAFCTNNEIVLTESRADNVDINQFPFPYRDENSFFLNQKHFSMITSRGCYANCSFCSVSSFSKITATGTKWRLRSEENVIDEIIEIQKKFDVNAISFFDSTFIGKDNKSITRINKFCELLEENNIHINFSIECRANAVNEKLFAKLIKYGLKNVFVGLESGTDNGLKLFNKGVSLKENQIAINILKKLGVDSQFGFINFYPEMNFSDFIKNIDFLHKNNILTSKALASRLCIYHGTAYAERSLPQVQLDDNNYEINYYFNDERINILSQKCRSFARLIEPYEIALSKLVFEISTSTTNNVNASEIISLIRDTKRKINSLLFHIGNDLYEKIGSNSHLLINLQNLGKGDEYLSEKITKIKNDISFIKYQCQRR